MDTPTNPPNASGPEPAPDLSRPPIWETPAPPAPKFEPPAPTLPVVPPVTAEPSIASRPATRIPPPPPPRPAPASASPAPAISAPGADYREPSPFTATGNRPSWPTAPPSVGDVPASPHTSAAPAPSGRGRRAGLVALALAALVLFAAAAFFVGRTLGESAAESPVVDTTASVEAAPAPTLEPTEEPAPPTATAVPPTPAPAPAPATLDAEEPVAAAAAAVAPAVVLITHELGQGSGIVYDADGLILTNAHVVGQFTEVRVQLASGKTVAGQVVDADPLTDVAVVQIDPTEDFGVAELAPESSVQVGQLAVAIGSPFGLEQTVTSGVVSAVGRVLINETDGGDQSVVAMVQTDAPINPGNSGGALVDRQGRVVGMNTSIRTDGSGGNIGVGFAIPAETAKLIADRIVAGESLEQGFLGIEGTAPLVGDPGVVVTKVEPGSGAAAAGVLVEDKIVGFNGRPIMDMGDLAAAVRLEPPDATVAVDILRDGEAIILNVTLGQRTGS